MPTCARTSKAICVFCGSAAGSRPEYAEAAADFAAALADRGYGLVYGGGNVGLMGVVADAALSRGVRVIGVIPRALADKELAHYGIDDLRVVDSMHSRKALMADLADAFVALPGGIGTFEEFFEMLTWGQLGLHAKPCALLDVGGYYDDLLALLDRSVREGFLKPKHRSRVLVAREPALLLDAIDRYAAPAEPAVLGKFES